MPNEAVSAKVVCPFYRGISIRHVESAELKMIDCEGLNKECSLHLSFHRNVPIKTWLQQHCLRYDYETVCPIAGMLMKNYDNAEFAKAKKEAGL